MAIGMEDLKVLQRAEAMADALWKHVIQWQPFAQEVVGKQLARAADSVGANIAESFGRFDYGEKLQFMYFARGSLFETRYWLRRAQSRSLISSDVAQACASQLTDIAKQLNAFAATLKAQQSTSSKRTIRESAPDYSIANSPIKLDLFTDDDLYLFQSSISNL